MISLNKCQRAPFFRGVLIAVLSLLVAGCSSPKAEVVATTGLIADAAERISGGKVKVEALMGPGVDPHRYQPTAGDLGKLGSAKLILFNGLHLEGKMSDLLEHSMSGRAGAVTKNIDPQRLLTADIDGGVHDPHVWFDVRLWVECVKTVRDEMCTAFPEHADAFRANAETYLKELTDLDAEVRAKAERLPKDRRVLFTSHDAFGYFARAYGFEVFGLQGVSTSVESGTKDVQKLADEIGRRRVPAVFTETSVPTQGLEQVLAAVASKHSYRVKLVGGEDALGSDALGEPGSPTGTYIGMVRHNIDVIVKALSP